MRRDAVLSTGSLLFAVVLLSRHQSLVNGTWARSRTVFRQAASCAQLESLLHNPLVTDIHVSKWISVKDCAWRMTEAPHRTVNIIGKGRGAIIDFRGLGGARILDFARVIKFERVMLLCDSEKEDNLNTMLLPLRKEAHLILNDVILGSSHCIMNGFPWPQLLARNELPVSNVTTCLMEDGGFMMERLVVTPSQGGRIQLFDSSIHCQKIENPLQSEEVPSCSSTIDKNTPWTHFNIVLLGLALLLGSLLAVGIAFIVKEVIRQPQQQIVDTSENMYSLGGDVEKDGLKIQSYSYPASASLEGIKIGGVIGKGGFSTVYHATLNGSPVAVKVFENNGASLLDGKESFEAYISSTIEHPNVVRAYSYKICGGGQFPGAFKSLDSVQGAEASVTTVSDVFDMVEMTSPITEKNRSRTWLVMEYCNYGSLAAGIQKGLFCEDKELNLPNLQLIVLVAIDVARAMQYLHSEGVIHGDLKSQNILLQQSPKDSRGYVCKVCDFGFSKLALNRTHIQTFTCGSVRAMPPEVLKDGILTPAADVYSFGILLWELLSGHPPYKGWYHQTIMHRVVTGHRPRIPTQWPSKLKDLICKCLLQKHRSRPSFKAILDCLTAIEAGQAAALDSQTSLRSIQLDHTADFWSTETYFTCSCKVDGHMYCTAHAKTSSRSLKAAPLSPKFESSPTLFYPEPPSDD